MMNAVITAENRPDSTIRQAFWFYEKKGTYKNESGIQIFAVFLMIVIVVFRGFSFKSFVETCPGVRVTALFQDRFQGVTQSLF